MVPHAPLGELLVQAGALAPSQLQRGLASGRARGVRLGRVLIEERLAEPEAVSRALAEQLGLRHRPHPLEPAPDAVALIDHALAQRSQAVPLALEGRTLRVAMEDPLDLHAVGALEFQSGRRVQADVASAVAVRAGLLRAYGGEFSRIVEEMPSAPTAEHATRRLEREARSAPVVRLVNLLLQRAVQAGASDVHVEGTEPRLSVRLRVDGILRPLFDLPEVGRDAVVSRIKIMAGMDIAERRRPQDGGFSLSIDEASPQLAVRASTLPVDGGEKVVLRLLEAESAPSDLEALGMSEIDLGRLRRVLAAQQGLVLVAGPTGSGKSTTLRAALGELDRRTHNVVTIEDPIEYRTADVQHVEVRRSAGLTFPAILRSVLRQDPDIVMVGEVRDPETAQIAISAAVTGHLVLSTLHTIDAAGALTRLMNMDVPAYLVAAGVSAVIAQRLVRTSCPSCRGRPQGCAACTDGYRGRTGVFQLLVMDDALRERVVSGASTVELRRQARRAGTRTLVEDAQRVVAEGRSSPHEVARVLQSDPGASLPCSHCGTPLPDGSRGCPGCGRPTELRCSCERRLQAHWRFCPSCRRKVGL